MSSKFVTGPGCGECSCNLSKQGFSSSANLNVFCNCPSRHDPFAASGRPNHRNVGEGKLPSAKYFLKRQLMIVPKEAGALFQWPQCGGSRWVFLKPRPVQNTVVVLTAPKRNSGSVTYTLPTDNQRVIRYGVQPVWDEVYRVAADVAGGDAFPYSVPVPIHPLYGTQLVGWRAILSDFSGLRCVWPHCSKRLCSHPKSRLQPVWKC